MNLFRVPLLKIGWRATALFVTLLVSHVAESTSIINWNKQDIGTAAIPGSVSENQDTITLEGSGNDIWGSQDNFYYVYIPVRGDATITVRVVSIENTHPWAKASIMFRETLDSGSVNVALDYSAHEHIAFQWRPVANNRSYYWGRNVGAGPYYLKLMREGNVFSGYYSSDNINWQLTTQKTINMADDIYLGLAGSPHVIDQNATAVFDSLSVQTSDTTTMCYVQGAQCGTIDDGMGGAIQCGACEANSACNSNQCSPMDPTYIAQACAAAGASCGPIRDGQGNTISCGGCDTGESCSSNRCESSCSLTQIDDGPFDNLLAYAPLQFAYEDLSPNGYSVQTTLLEHNTDNQLFPFESSVDMTAKNIQLQLGSTSISQPMTLSFKMQPSEANQEATIIESDALSLKESSGALTTTFETLTNPVTLLNNASTLKHRSCNHVAVQVDASHIRTFLNGQSAETAVNTATLQALSGTLNIGPYNGKVWDVRIYERVLTPAEITSIGSDCDDAQSKPLPDPTYPNYLCGVYQCIYWPDGVTDTTQDSFEYQLSGHEMTWEHNVLETGMYKHGQLCAEYEKPRDLLLTEGYRKSWVSKFNFEKPWNQYVLHENFHAYQSRTGGSTKFLAESSASWGAFSQKPTAYDTILGMYTLQPQLALWTTQSSVFEEGIIDYAKGGHQYGAAIWEWYVTHHVLNDDHFIGKVFNRNVLNLAPLTGKPSEGMYNALAEAGFDMRDVFSDFAARVTTWDVDYADTFIASEVGSFNRMNGNNNNSDNPIPSEEVDNKIAEFYDHNGTQNQWLTVPSRYKIGDWAYNAYQVDVTSNTTYEVGINPSVSNPAYSEFRAQVVVHNEQSGERQYYKIPNTTAGIASSIMVYAEAGEKLYLVVANTPSTKFNEFKAYTYDYLISAQ